MTQSQILEVQVSHTVGGIETFLKNLCTVKVNSKSVKFTIVGNNASTELKDEFLNANCEFLETPKSKNLFIYLKFWKRLFTDNTFDIVHFHKNSNANIIPIIMAKIYSKSKIVIHSHNSAPSVKGRLLLLLNYINRPIVNSLADYKLAVSNKAFQWLFGKKTKYNEKKQIIKNGINTQIYKFNETKRRQVRVDLSVTGNFVFGHVGRFTEQKNHELIIELFERVHKTHKDTKLILIGNGPLRKKIENVVYSKGLNNSVKFVGEVDNVSDYLMAMDCFILPSVFEGLPIAMLEAEATGLPVFASSRVPKAAALTTRCFFVDLSNKKKWEKNLDEIINQRCVYSKNRKSFAKIVDDQGFGITQCINSVNQVYDNLIYKG